MLISAVVGAVSAAGNTFFTADLRTDLPEVYSAGDYRVKIAAERLPATAFPSYTAGYLGINLAPPESASQITRVGLMADQTGLYWFVYSQSLIRCLQGTPVWWSDALGQYQGCKESAIQMIQQGFSHTVELVSYGQGEWIARVFDTAETGYDIAVITNPGEQVYDADVNFEEAYVQLQDPYLSSAFVFYRPQYNTWNSAEGFADWPANSTWHRNTLYADSASNTDLCPSHYAVKSMYGSPRAWYAGTSGVATACSLTLFNETYLPLVKR